MTCFADRYVTDACRTGVHELCPWPDGCACTTCHSSDVDSASLAPNVPPFEPTVVAGWGGGRDNGLAERAPDGVIAAAKALFRIRRSGDG